MSGKDYLQPADYYERYTGILEITLDSHPNGQLAVFPNEKY
jgi:hypothetical protein